MHAIIRSSFAFLVVAYNHQKYILEHLESVKYLVQTHGVAIDVDIIINDDCSNDQTRTLIDNWLQINAGLFRHVKTIYNQENLGTCASINNMISCMVADRCKLTAGDDVYSFENIFELTKHSQDVAMLSGRALYLCGDELTVDRRSRLLATATQIIYHKDSLLYRFKHLSYNNAPNIQYASECLLDPEVRAHLKNFDVTEDWPLQIAIARRFAGRKFVLIDEVLVYYRRTEASTYLVANKRFIKDKMLIYDDLIANEANWLEKFRLLSRKMSFLMKYRTLGKIFNIDLYIFFASCLLNFNKIRSKYNKVHIALAEHTKHYARIKDQVRNSKLAL